MENNQILMETYDWLEEYDLQNFFSAFSLQLGVSKKEDLLKLCVSDLNRIGIVSRLSVKRFEDLVSYLRINASITTKNLKERLSSFIVDTMLIQQEPVIISSTNLQYGTALGEGHFGKVYKGLWQRKHNGEDVKIPVAIKTLTDGVEMSWKKEVAIFTALNQNHPCIIKFFGLLVSDADEVKMVTEFAALGSLADRLRSRKITSIAILSQFCVQIATGMIFLHSKNLLHRDLSARNILVTGPDQVKISDFGLSKVVSETDQAWVMDSNELLPMRWLSPEAYNKGIFTTASDVWSFAVVLWEMFSFGNVPWCELDNEQVKERIENGVCLQEPSVCPSGIYDVMKTCFRFAAEERPPFHVIREELLANQPETVVAVVDENTRQHLNFNKTDYITSIKHIDNDLWLGQHEKTLLFGSFKCSSTEELQYKIPQDNNDNSNQMDALPSGQEIKTMTSSDENKENQSEEHYQVPRTILQTYEDMKNLQEKQSENILYENMSPMERPRSQIVLSTTPLHERTYELETLKSDSDSQLMFKDINPAVQATVNDRIASNMNAFVSFLEPKKKEEENAGLMTSNGYLIPVDVSVKPPLENIIKLEDPFSRLRSASEENIYEEIVTPPLERKFQSSETVMQRPRPKPRNLNNALDKYADSVREDFHRFSKSLNKPVKPPRQSIPPNTNGNIVSTQQLEGSSGVRNHEYLHKYSHVIIPNTKNDKLQNTSLEHHHVNNTPAASTGRRFNVDSTSGDVETTLNRRHVLTRPNPSSSTAFNDYFHSPKDGKQRKDFKYNINENSKLAELPITAKERAKRAVTNYTNNDWHLFDDCVVKGTKRTDRKSSSADEISWPQDMSKLSQSKKEEFSTKFQSIRQQLPDASVSDCLDGLRYSENDVSRAVKYIKTLKLTRHNFGVSFEHCWKLLEAHKEKYETAEKALKTEHIKEQFPKLDETQINELLQISSWDVKDTLTTIFLQKCLDIGVQASKAENILKECGHEVKKSLEMAKIVRLAEITNKSEHSCFKTLTHCNWNIERAVEHIFTQS